MGRHNGNARPKEEVAPVTPELVAHSADSPVTPTAERHHAFRDAAKHAPSRVSSRMYAQVRTITAALDDAELHLSRANLPEHLGADVRAQLVANRDALKTTREQIPDAVRDRSLADPVKAQLSHLVAVTKLLDPAIAALVHHAKAEKAVSATEELSEEQVARWDEARRAARGVLESLSGGRPGRISSSLARLRGTEPVPLAA